MLKSLYLLAALSCGLSSTIALELASPFGDHMVLQRNQVVPVWGKADQGARVVVEFAGQQVATTADAAGQWRVDLQPMEASAEARSFSVSSGEYENLVFQDVLVGEVWLCGGQSNMERQLGLREGQKPIDDWEAEAAAADYPLIRQLYVEQTLASEPLSEVAAAWAVCSPGTVADFSAVGYFFARDLYAKLGIPIGFIHSSWGGTPAEAWTSERGLSAFPEFAASIEAMKLHATDPNEAVRIYERALAEWFSLAQPARDSDQWWSRETDSSGWPTMELPAMWEAAGYEGFDGIGWFRKTFDLPAAWTGLDLELRLGVIDDIDTTWVNGTQVGQTSGWNTPRAYRIAAGTLRPNNNVIAVRVLDTGGGGGLWDPSHDLELKPVSDAGPSLSLNGPWQARMSASLADIASPPPLSAGRSSNSPTALFNGMVAPLIPYAIRGVAFYQGEANASRPEQYRKLFPAMIDDWRQRWGQGPFAFLFVQVAPYIDMPPEIREAQLQAWLETKNTAMVVTIDIGDAEDIHPTRKAPVGERLALAARAIAYGEALEYSGPVVRAVTTKANTAIISFDHVGTGLTAGDGGSLTGFSIAGQDGIFHPATASIENDQVTVISTEVESPTAVRYGWKNVAEGNLFNNEGLPASPFRAQSK